MVDAKFCPPPLARQIERDALVGRMHDAEVGLIVLHAAAGYGKSTLLSQWRRHLIATGCAVAWLSLDEHDRDIDQFLAYLVEAFRRAECRGGSGAAARLSELAALPTQVVIPAILHEVASAGQSMVLLLDDYHRAESETIDQALRSLLEQRPPQLGIAVASRTLPRLGLGRLRAESLVTLLGVDDLRFGEAETSLFFAEEVTRLDPAAFGRFVTRTEGWPVALQFARTWLREGGDLAALDCRSPASELADYFSEQVFATLPLALQDFLLRTAALEFVSEDIARALGIERPGACLKELLRLALPMVPLDAERTRFRYHHLLEDFLLSRAREQDIDVAAIRRTAAGWLAATGDLALAVRHALAGGRPGMAADIIEAAGGWRLVYCGHGHLGATIRAVHLAMSTSGHIRPPRFMLGVAVTAAKQGELAAATEAFRDVLVRGDAETFEIGDEILTIRALLALYRDEALAPAELAALESMVARMGSQDPMHAGLATNLLAFLLLQDGDYARARRVGWLAVRRFRDAQAPFGEMHLYAHIGQAELALGNVAAALDACRTMRDLARQYLGPDSDIGAIACVLIAEVLHQAGQRDDVRPLLTPALERIERADGWLDVFAAGYLTAARLDLLDHGLEAARAAIGRGMATAARRQLPRLHRMLLHESIRVSTLAGDLDAAAAEAAQAGLCLDARPTPGLLGVSLLRGEAPALLLARLALYRGRAEVALHALDEAAGTIQSGRCTIAGRITALVLRSLAERAAGREDSARRSFATASALACTTTLFRPLLDGGAPACALAAEVIACTTLPDSVRAQLTEVFGRGSAVPAVGVRLPPAEGPSLTARQRQVLGLLAQGMTNKEIGRQIAVGPDTVEYHLKRLFAKLAVERRTSAIVRGRVYGLLD